MAKKSKKVVTALALVEQIDWILKKSKYYESRERGKRFYDPGDFPSKLASYASRGGLSASAQARHLGMSVATLKRLMSGDSLSDTMLIRIRSALSEEARSNEKEITFAGDWHSATPKNVATAISIVSDKLVFLKKVIENSNFLMSADSPIDKIQILQLIALLTATIEALRAPFVDKKQTSGFFKWLRKFTKASAQKGLEKIVTDAMADAASAGADLIHHLSSQVGWPDLGNIGPN